MPPLSEKQCLALLEAKRLLKDVGLEVPQPEFLAKSITDHLASPASKTPPLAKRIYDPPLARKFTAEERSAKKDYVTRQTRASAIVNHPVGSIVEYPETGQDAKDTIAHIFSIDPTNFTHPKANFQYSLGDSHGGRRNVECKSDFLVDDVTGLATKCKVDKFSCKGMKLCEVFSSSEGDMMPHDATAEQEVFNKTFAFFCVLLEKGCMFDVEKDGAQFEDVISGEHTDFEADSEEDSDTAWQQASGLCRGQMVICTDALGRPYIQCEHRSHTDRAHRVLHNLDEFDTTYLRALLSGNSETISRYEERAKLQGYGPLSPCTYSAPPSAQQQRCPYWHRFSNGEIRRGHLSREVEKCHATFTIYTPYNLVACSRVLILCKGRHSHLRPPPTKTPPEILQVFSSLLLDMNWKLADATPRKIMVDSGFIQGLRAHLHWNHPLDPALSDLHPSLGNLDHTRRYIETLRLKVFPKGTGFEGAQLLAQQHQLPTETDPYVRCAEEHTLANGKPFRLIICMSRSMSTRLMQSKFLSIDTSFKRVHHKWQEFEIESWDENHMRSVVGVRAFTTSQSAEAHFILFRRIFEFATADTKIPVHFHHIHRDGFLVWIADAHKGQALGLGMFCQSLSKVLGSFCEYEPHRRLRELDPYEHLRRFFRICITHFKRNIHDIGTHVSPGVKAAMLSLASSEPHPDLEGAFKIIENGGSKAKAWLNDKRVTNKFAIPALYQPASLIPLGVWRASPSTTNGNEQAHRNINRDGVNLTVLGGIMRGMQYDHRAAASLDLHATQGIYNRDQLATHFHRLGRSVNRHAIVQRRTLSQRNQEPVKRRKKKNPPPPPPPSMSTVQDLEEIYPSSHTDSAEDITYAPYHLQTHENHPNRSNFSQRWGGYADVEDLVWAMQVDGLDLTPYSAFHYSAESSLDGALGDMIYM